MRLMVTAVFEVDIPHIGDDSPYLVAEEIEEWADAELDLTNCALPCPDFVIGTIEDIESID